MKCKKHTNCVCAPFNENNVYLTIGFDGALITEALCDWNRLYGREDSIYSKSPA